MCLRTHLHTEGVIVQLVICLGGSLVSRASCSRRRPHYANFRCRDAILFTYVYVRRNYFRITEPNQIYYNLHGSIVFENGFGSTQTSQ